MQGTTHLSTISEQRIQSAPSRKPELFVFGLLLLVLNFPLVSGQWNHPFTFLPGAVTAGEWWRLLTFPFVHVSVYHLAIDATAFFFLYGALPQPTVSKRLFLFCLSAAASLLVSLWTNPIVAEVGLCGLSGVCHGLMAICLLDLFKADTRAARVFGYSGFSILLGKCLLEAITGRLLFDLTHPGSVGTPIAICHAGGMLGALIGFGSLKFIRSKPHGTAGASAN